MNDIRNEDLILESLPDVADRDSVFEFAMSFNGFEHHGSFEKCAAAAKSRTREDLSALRNELFFEARASRHRMDDEFLDIYRELLPLIQAALTDR
ncbi:MAG: hypothetical protein AAFV47_11050 [Pseudomonadota bacterium]